MINQIDLTSKSAIREQMSNVIKSSITFGPSSLGCPLKPKSARFQEQTQKTLRNTPQNGEVNIWVMRFHFWASIEPIFKDRIFSIVFDPFFPFTGQKHKG